MRQISYLISFAILSLSNGCGAPKKGAADPTAVLEQEGDFEPPTCEAGEVKIKYPKGQIAEVANDPDAERISDEPEYDEVLYNFGDHEITHNTISGGHALIKFGKDQTNKLVFAWQDTDLKDGEPIGMRGFIATDKIDVGNCEDPSEYVSKLTYQNFLDKSDQISATFVLRKTKRHPYCTGEVFSQTIAGCFKKK